MLCDYFEPLEINIEGLESILLQKGLFIQIHFGGLCYAMLCFLDKEYVFRVTPGSLDGVHQEFGGSPQPHGMFHGIKKIFANNEGFMLICIFFTFHFNLSRVLASSQN